MTLESASCYYHPNREAVTKCERCNHMICLEDKITKRIYGGSDRADTVIIYCPTCVNELEKARKEFLNKLKPFFILLVVCLAFIAILVIIDMLFDVF